MSRFNVYSEELTYRVERVTKEANGQTFHGVRFYLKSPPELHHSAEDDDTSAVTFWSADRAQLEHLMILAHGAAGV